MDEIITKLKQKFDLIVEESTGRLVQSVGTVYCVDGAGGLTPPQRVLAIWLVL